MSEYDGYESAFVPSTPGRTDDTTNKDESPKQIVKQGAQKATGEQNPVQPTIERSLGKRYWNPLGYYSSYTYQLSLYMISPDAYDVFVRNGRRDIEIVNQADAGCGGGAYLIAQSGGINNTTSLRAPGFHYDFGIDNLVVNSVFSPEATGSPVKETTLSFTIYEQYGFSFINNLKRAKDAMDAYSTTINIKDSTNSSRQFFVLGVKFLGYDKAGNVINGNSPDDTFNRYFDIGFTKIDFKIDGRATTYNIQATCIPVQMAMGQKRGVIDQGANQLQGKTVRELCQALCDKINKDQEKQVPDNREFGNFYSIEFIDDAEEIAESSIVSTADLRKEKWPMSVPKSKGDVNPGLEVKAQPNNNQRILAFNRDTPIIQAIQTIINQSDYLIKGLKKVYTTEPQPDKEGNAEPIDSNKRAKWFNISTVVSNAKFDRKIKDYSFDITYQIRTYETPVVLSTAADKTAQYYGPFKRYEYWLTGQNSEIIKYEQTMNNSYFTVALDTMGSDSTSNQGTGGKANVPVATQKRTNAPRLGKLDVGMEAQNNYVTSLTDPGAYAKASAQILGDPDLLPNDQPTGNPELDTKSQPFYGPDQFSIDTKIGQCFIEIDFKEAVDYDHEQGIMRVNENIIFWEYPPHIQKNVKGIVYQLIGVKSTFRAGRFTQDLDLTMATFGDDKPYSETEKGREEAKKAAEEEKEKKKNAPVGLVEDKPVGDTAGGDPCASPAAAKQQSVKPTNQQTTKKGTTPGSTNREAVADDDAATRYGSPVEQGYLDGQIGLPGA